MEAPANRSLAWRDYQAARGRFFDRLALAARPAVRGGLIPEEDHMSTIHPPAPAAVPPLEAAWCTRWPEEVAACFTPDGVRHQLALPEGRFQGRAAVARAAAAIIHAVPDGVLEVVRVVRSDSATVLEWVLRGTHVGGLPGLPARGEPIELPGISLCTMDGALIREERVYWDTATLMAQAGLLSSPVSAPGR